MSNDITSYNSTAPLIGGNGQLPAKIEKRTRRDAAEVVGRAIVATTKVQAAAFVAHTALAQVAALSAEEAARSAADPIAADRYAGIVNDYVFAARSILRGMAS